MAQAAHARINTQVEVYPRLSADTARSASATMQPGGIRLAVYEDLAAIERDWRNFEQQADCTVFQTFDWLATWQFHIGVRNGVRPAIVVGRDAQGKILFLLPLSIRSKGFVRELTWLGSELCDYNAPLLAVNFSREVDAASFALLLRDIARRLQGYPRLQYDFIRLEKMPVMVGGQPNPILCLGVALNPSGSYLAHLSENWDAFYAAKRSSTTRRRDRGKRKRLAESGLVRFVDETSDIETTLDTLMQQKARSFARMGVVNLFARPGHAEFYRALATDPATKHLVHMSRLDVGSTPAAVNFGLTFRHCYYHLLASYDDGELSRFGPGAAHLHELLRYAIERGFRIFDFTIGDERYKRDWCDTELELYDHISMATWRGAVIVIPILAMHRLKRWIKQTPVLWNAFSKGRAFVGSLAAWLADKTP